jgi:predicted ATPase
LQLTPRFAAGMTVGADIPASCPTVVGAIIIGTEVLLGIDTASTSPWERQQWGWRGERLWAGLSGLLTRLTEGLVGETGKGWGALARFLRGFADVGVVWSGAGRPCRHAHHPSMPSQSQASINSASKSGSCPMSSPSGDDGRGIYHPMMRFGNYPCAGGTGPLQAVSSLDESTLQQGLRQLVEAELLYQRGSPPQATYTFKHALIQETAYQSLLKSTRQQFHQRLAQALENRFPEAAAAQPELLAHHYTEAGLIGQAIPYWRRAGERAIQGSANVEAISHLTKGLELLATLPETLARAQQELDFLMALGPALMATQGPATLEVEQTYARTRALCQQIGETPQLFSTLWGLCRFYRARGALPTARELGEQLDRLAQRKAAPTPCLEARDALGSTLFHLGEYAAAQADLEQGIALTDPTEQRALALRHDVAPGVTCLAYAANILWCLGFPAQAVRRSQEALALAQTLSHPYSLAFARYWAALLHYRRREALVAFEESERGDLLAETHRLQGELLLRQAAPDAVRAQACFQQALAVARRQQAKSWELRAAMSLSRLWQRQNKRAEAYALLDPIYGWFTEGFDTADLQEAKAPLDELA